MISRQKQTATKRACPPSGRIIAFHQQIMWQTRCHSRVSLMRVLIFFWAFHILCLQNSYLFLRGDNWEPFFSSFSFVLFWMSALFECGSVYTHEDRWIWRWYEQPLPLSLAMSRTVLFSSCRLPRFVSVFFSINNNCWIKLSKNLREKLCYGCPSC